MSESVSDYLRAAAREAADFLREAARDGDAEARRELMRHGLKPPLLSTRGLQKVAADMPDLDELRDRDLRKRKYKG